MYFKVNKSTYSLITAITIFFIVSCCTAHAKIFPEQIEPGEDWSPEQVESWKYNNMVYSLKEIVYSSTKYPKEIRHIAENMTVVDAEDIERMQAHTLSEVLSRITGVFVSQAGHDFGSVSHIDIQGSSQTQVLVLVDGIKWNFISGGNVETNSIPIGIIKQIEIIKGPASSVWGSSLGGVINIITKSGESELMPDGMVSASIGEQRSIDTRAEMSGKHKTLSYYLYGQHQSSDGLRYDRDFQNNSLYGKIYSSFSDSIKAGASFGISGPELTAGKNPTFDEEYPLETDIYWGTLFAESQLSDQANLNISIHHLKQKLTSSIHSLGTGVFDYPAKKLVIRDDMYDEKITGIKSRLVYKTGRHTAVTGAEYYREEAEQSGESLLNSYWEFLAVPLKGEWKSDIDKYAFYANDSFTLGKFSLTPGVRYDYNDITGSFISPSFGATCKTSPSSVLRASIARGFSAPPLSYISGGSIFLVPNSDLDTEEVWSYQAGFETAAINYLLIKSTLFFHDVNDTITQERTEDSKIRFINGQGSKRSGFELEIKTSRYRDFALTSGFAYVHTAPEGDDSHNKYSINVDLLYDDLESISALLSGRYTDIDKEINPEYNSDFLWDFNVSKKINFLFYLKRSVEIFGSVHNIFNGNQYSDALSKNPDRWVESGIRLRF